jgi:DNA-binding MarR family transcriptional regulator
MNDSTRANLMKQIDSAIMKMALDSLSHRGLFAERVYLSTHIRVAPSVFTLLDQLSDKSMRVTELAVLTGTPLPSATRHIRDLEEKGLIDRTPDEFDGRASIVTLSAKGRRLAAEMQGMRFTSLSDCLAGWSDGELEQLLPTVSKLAEDLSRRHEFEEPQAAPALRLGD